MLAIQILLGMIGILVVGFALPKLHHWLISLEDRGYIYYRNKSRGSAGSVLFEVDKLTRPSVEHVQNAMQIEVESQKIDGE